MAVEVLVSRESGGNIWGSLCVNRLTVLIGIQQQKGLVVAPTAFISHIIPIRSHLKRNTAKRINKIFTGRMPDISKRSVVWRLN